MEDTKDSCELTIAEIRTAFADPHWGAKFPPILTLQQAAELLQIPLQTLYDWRSRRILSRCSKKVGREVRILRDRLVLQYFNGELNHGK